MKSQKKELKVVSRFSHNTKSELHSMLYITDLTETRIPDWCLSSSPRFMIQGVYVRVCPRGLVWR